MAFLNAGPMHPVRRVRSRGLLSPRLVTPSRRPAHSVPTRRVRATLDSAPVSADLPEPLPLIDESGSVAPDIGAGVVGVFAVLDADRRVRHVGISRDVATSLRRTLARRPDDAYMYFVQRFSRPSRTALEEVRSAWADAARAAGTLDEGRLGELWGRPVDVQDPLEGRVGKEMRERINTCESREREKVLKSACREIQKDIERKLKERGLTEALKFGPKLKGKGLLDVESVKVAVPDSI